MLYGPKVLPIIMRPTPKITITPPTLVDDEYITSRRQQLTEQFKIPKEDYLQATTWLDNMRAKSQWRKGCESRLSYFKELEDLKNEVAGLMNYIERVWDFSGGVLEFLIVVKGLNNSRYTNNTEDY